MVLIPSVTVTCEYCKQPCEKSPHQVKTNKSGIFFCSAKHQQAWIREHKGWNKGGHITFGYRRPLERKVLGALSFEWQTVKEIAMVCGTESPEVLPALKVLKNEGKAEYMFDEILGRAYWRKPEGERLHRASEEVRS